MARLTSKQESSRQTELRAVLDKAIKTTAPYIIAGRQLDPMRLREAVIFNHARFDALSEILISGKKVTEAGLAHKINVVLERQIRWYEDLLSSKTGQTVTLL